jgi:hypothetical protein
VVTKLVTQRCAHNDHVDDARAERLAALGRS